jgi:hypothetical protein
MTGNSEGSSAPLGFENTLWQAADALRGSMDAAEDHVLVLGRVEEVTSFTLLEGDCAE